jgi:SET domain-containing protein
MFHILKSVLVVLSHAQQGTTLMPKPKKWTTADFEVKASIIEGAGRGLFAKVRLEPKDTIGYYTGEVINSDQFHHPDRPFSAYVLWVCHSHIIVGEGPQANYTRFINHSDAPNASLIVSSRWKSARFEALRVIEPCEEIFFDYGEDYWEKDELLIED